MQNTYAKAFAEELKAEYTATKKCLERIPQELSEYKPHPRSMKLGYLALLVAEIPMWITTTIKEGEIDFATFRHEEPGVGKSYAEMFDQYFKEAIETLEHTDDEQLDETFTLKSNGQQLFSSSKKESIGSSINHWVHHRGQLTVYMRLNDIPVPSVYGPSADEKQY
jgi:uncharacterized damage-inducible protein DinB